MSQLFKVYLTFGHFSVNLSTISVAFLSSMLTLKHLFCQFLICFSVPFKKFMVISPSVYTCQKIELFIYLIDTSQKRTIILKKHEFQGTNYCGSAENKRRPLAEFLYNVVMGFVCIFDYINLKEGPTRLKHFLYYLTLGFEAAILMSLWYFETSKKVKIHIWR